jgi:hypothetical protein
MTSIAGISTSTTVAAATNAPPRDAATPREPRLSTSRALIAVQPVASGETPVRTHPDARFLAHLIATDQRMPQTRERRRAEPQAAIAAYAAANSAPTAPAGQRIFRVM